MINEENTNKNYPESPYISKENYKKRIKKF